MRFKEFQVGQELHAGPVRLGQPEIIAFAEAYDPQWFHTNPQQARSSRWRGIIVSGWHTCAIAMRLVSKDLLKDSESIGSPGLAYVKWPAPVRPEDELRLEAQVIETRISKNHCGVLRWRWKLLNQASVIVLDLESTSLFELRAQP